MRRKYQRWRYLKGIVPAAVFSFSLFPCFEYGYAFTAKTARAFAALTHIENLAFASDAETKLTAKGNLQDFDNPGQQLDIHTKADFAYVGDGKNYYVHCQNAYVIPSKPPRSIELAYNGFHFQRLYSNGALHLSTSFTDHENPDLYAGQKSAFFAPFWFLIPEALTSPHHLDHPSGEKWSGRLTSFFKAARQLDERVKSDGKNCVVYEHPFKGESPNFPEWASLKDVLLRVYFSIEDDGYPVRWQLISSKQRLLAEYFVKDLGHTPLKGSEISTLAYPRVAFMHDYGIFSENPAPRPSSASRYRIQEITVNGLLDEEKFTLDPARARVIFDEDSNTGITVPN